jgi:excisionase family DNA binding protein
MDRLLLVSEIAERLRCSESTVYNHIAQSRLEAYCVGKSKGYRVSEDQLQRFLDRMQTKAPPSGDFKHLKV